MSKQRLEVNVGCGNVVLSFFKGLAIVIIAIAIGVIGLVAILFY